MRAIGIEAMLLSSLTKVEAAGRCFDSKCCGGYKTVKNYVREHEGRNPEMYDLLVNLGGLG